MSELSITTLGVMTPSIPSAEVAMKLAVVGVLYPSIICMTDVCVCVCVYMPSGTVPDHFIGERVIVDYLLYKLNQSEMYKYVHS